MRTFILTLLLLVFLPAWTIAQDAQADLNEALTRLSTQRNAISAEKAALLEAHQQLEAIVREKRRAWELLKVSAGKQEATYEARRQDVAKLESQLAALETALEDYRAHLETNLHAAELAEYQAIELPADASTAQRWQAFADFGLMRLEESEGGRVVPGKAVAPSGELVDGRYLIWEIG
ncbi:MAG: hypothetical protein ACQKBV_00460, partial [Puniceicoccales bacterium]